MIYMRSHPELNPPPGSSVNRNPNVGVISDDELFDEEDSEDGGSLGYEEYTDEPSKASWKRRRKSEEIL